MLILFLISTISYNIRPKNEFEALYSRISFLEQKHEITTTTRHPPYTYPPFFGGEKVHGTEHAYVVVVYLGIRPVCSGVLVTHRHVLTAARCLYKTDDVNQEMSVVGGRGDLHDPGDIFRVIHRIQHERYDHKRRDLSYENNIVLLVLHKSVPQFSDHYDVARKKMGQANEEPGMAERCVMVGFGSTNWSYESYELPYERSWDIYFLHRANLYLLNATECMKARNLTEINSRSVICAQDPQHLVMGCTTNEGGPLICDNKLLGILTLELEQELKCELTDEPMLFMNVSYYSGWIDNHTGQYVAPPDEELENYTSYASLYVITRSLQILLAFNILP